MLLRILAAAAILIPACLVAHADTLVPYQLKETFSDGGTLLGTINIDIDTIFLYYHPYDSTANLTYTLNGTSVALSGTNDDLYLGDSNSGIDTLGLGFGDEHTIQFEVIFPVASPGVSYSSFSGGLCTLASTDCNGTYSFQNLYPRGIVIATSGTLTAVTATPEPATFGLLSTGLLGLLCVLRKRPA